MKHDTDPDRSVFQWTAVSSAVSIVRVLVSVTGDLLLGA